MEIASFVLAVLALGLSLVNAYKTWWEEAKLEILPAAHAELNSVDQNGRFSRVRVACNFVNPTGRLATLQHLELVVHAVHGPRMDFVWDEFWSRAEDSRALKSAGDAVPIVVGRYDSAFHTISFTPVAGEGDKWPQGRYYMVFRGWMNVPDRKGDPNVTSRHCYFTITALEIAKLEEVVPGGEYWDPVEFEEWLPPRA